MRCKAREICILLYLSRKELGSILLPHRLKNILIERPQDSGFIAYSKLFILESGFKKVADSYAGFTTYVSTEAVSGKKKLGIKKYPDTCRRVLISVTFHYILQDITSR